jgi:HEAT repeat protein
VGQVADLVTKFAKRFRPASDAAGLEAFRVALSEYCEAVRPLADIEGEIADGLRGLLFDRDSLKVLLWVHAAITRPSAGLVEPLCELLSVRDGYLQHEWVADLLGEIGDPRAIPALRDACSFDVAGDVFRSLPKRCLEALAAIGTPSAMEVVREQLASPWVEVREEARELLHGEDEG